jgi:hydrogenase maturation protease
MLKVIGLGNVLRGDDGIGPFIVNKLKDLNVQIPVQLVELDTDPFSILEHLIGPEPVLIIDCAKMGKKPGEIIKFDIKESNLQFADKFISLHSISFSEIYQIARNIGSVTKCNIIGVEPKSVNYNTGLSKEIENSVTKILEMVIKEAKYYAKKDFNN